MHSFDPIYLLFIPVFLFSLCLHEFAHAWTARIGGDMTAAYKGRLTLNPLSHIDPIGTILLPAISLFSQVPLLGWAKPVPVTEQRFRRSDWIVWVSVAGPLSNLLLVALAALVIKSSIWIGGADLLRDYDVACFRLGGEAGLSPGVVSLLYVLGIMFIQLNLVLAVFNMLPIPPLDGSKLIYYYWARGNSQRLAFWYGLHSYGFLLLYFIILFPPFRKALSMAYLVPFNHIITWLGS